MYFFGTVLPPRENIKGPDADDDTFVFTKDEKTDNVSMLIKFFSFNKFKISILENHLNSFSKSIFLDTKVMLF